MHKQFKSVSQNTNKMNKFLPDVPFFCIHLLRATEREAYMTHFQNGLGRLVEVWPASEGAEVAARGWPRGHPHERETSIGALGCLDSHIRLLRMMLEKEWDMMGIFEDDAELVVRCEKLQEFYTKVSQEQPEWDIFVLGANEWVDVKTQNQIARPVRYWGTHAFLIRRRAAAAVVQLFEELQAKGYSYPADWLYSYTISQKRLLAVGPEVCRSLIRQKPGLISAINGKVRS
jgi:GR25 family glycosyltransferase involved in LPS biosynthesis